MKPQDLVPPFSWRDPSVTIEDQIFYTFGKNEFSFPGWESLFGNSRPVHLEYCSGNGEWLAEQALHAREANWVGLEKRFMRVRKIWSKIKNHQLKNMFAICGEAYSTSTRFFPDQSLDSVFVNFPDPWPKRNHAKYRLIQTEFVRELSRTVKSGGTVTLVTDDAPYSEQMIRVMLENENFSSALPAPYFATDWQQYGGSFFERLWREKERAIRYHQFIRR